MRLVGFPRPVRRLVMRHQEERLVPRPAANELDGQIRDDVGGISAGVGLLARGRVEDRILIGALPRQDLPPIEPDRIAAEMPFADHAGVVAALLEQACHRAPGAVEPVEHRHAIQVRVLTRENRGAARRADRVGHHHLLEERAFLGEAIDVRRAVHPRSVRADRVRRVVVRHDEDDVRAIGRRRGRSDSRQACNETQRDDDQEVFRTGDHEA